MSLLDKTKGNISYFYHKILYECTLHLKKNQEPQTFFPRKRKEKNARHNK